MALWGEAVLASRQLNDSVTLAAGSGSPLEVRSRFVATGSLLHPDGGDGDGDGSKSMDNNASWPVAGVVGLAHDLGKVEDGGNQSVTFAVGYVRDEAINYLGEPYAGYYRAQHASIADAVAHFLDDYEAANAESQQLDSRLVDRAREAGGQKYADIVALSTRQAYGGIDLTIPLRSLDRSRPMAFIKELSSDGNVNTVDVIMPAFPIYYVFDADWIRLLLEPVMQYLAAGRWRQPYAIHDLGSSYPNATGHDDQRAEPMPIEECGNLIILTLAYVRATDDSAWAERYRPVLQPYADYLATHGIDIANQLSSNDAAGPLPNETNLAIKAAVGLKAFGHLYGLANYSAIADEHAALLFDQQLATDSAQSHFVLLYPARPRSWKIPYNLYPDVLLDLHTFPVAARSMGESFFHGSSVRGKYGVALDHRQDWAKSDWNMWTAATFPSAGNRSSSSSSSSTADQFIHDLWSFMTNGKHNWPFSDRYVSTDKQGDTGAGAGTFSSSNRLGMPILCRARPTVGGHFALLALQGAGSMKPVGAGQDGVFSSGGVPAQDVLGLAEDEQR